MDDPELVQGGGISSGRIYQTIHVDPKVERSKACKKLLLGSADNTLAEVIDRYIRVTFEGKNCVWCKAGRALCGIHVLTDMH